MKERESKQCTSDHSKITSLEKNGWRKKLFNKLISVINISLYFFKKNFVKYFYIYRDSIVSSGEF